VFFAENREAPANGTADPQKSRKKEMPARLTPGTSLRSQKIFEIKSLVLFIDRMVTNCLSLT
jgi:hypothetical protein